MEDSGDDEAIEESRPTIFSCLLFAAENDVGEDDDIVGTTECASRKCSWNLRMKSLSGEMDHHMVSYSSIALFRALKSSF